VMGVADLPADYQLLKWALRYKQHSAWREVTELPRQRYDCVGV
jgi:hypothetical protein